MLATLPPPRKEAEGIGMSANTCIEFSDHHSPITLCIFICSFLTRHSCFFATFRFIKFRRALVTKKLLVVPRTLRTRQSRQLSRKLHGPWRTLQSFDDSSRDIHMVVSKQMRFCFIRCVADMVDEDVPAYFFCGSQFPLSPPP